MSDTSAKYTNAAHTEGVFHFRGLDWYGALPPLAGDLRDAFDAWVAEGNVPELFVAPEPAPPEIRVYKASMFRKMTDAEYEAYLQIRANFPARIQAIFDAAEYLSSNDEFWPGLVAAAEQVYGPERAAELLAPSA